MKRAVRRRAAALSFIASVAAASCLVTLFACDETFTPACGEIPAEGCPRSTPRACDDRTCSALYQCRAGAWQKTEDCPPRPPLVDAGPLDSAPDVQMKDVDVDVPGASGGPGCLLLEAPDCTLGFASACPTGCCGCEDLFVCSAGGWDLWGTCTAAGIVKTP